MVKKFQFLFFLKTLYQFRICSSAETIQNYKFKSLLSGKYYRLLPDGVSFARNADLDCVIPNIHCLPDESNVIDVFFGVKSAGDCQLSCVYHHSDCAVFTWFDSDHSTFPRSCFLYSRCNKAIETVNSITGPPSCVCGKKMACQGVSNNFVGFKENILSEDSCQGICRDTDPCEFYTWFDDTNKVFYNYCFLFSSCEKVSCNCVGCSSGPPKCSPPVGEILPSPAPVQETKPGLVTPDNLSVPSSLLPPVNTEDTGLSSQIKEDTASIQISEDAANNFILNISNFSPGVVTEQSGGLNGLTNLGHNGNATQGFKSTILNYFPSLKWLFVFVD